MDFFFRVFLTNHGRDFRLGETYTNRKACSLSISALCVVRGLFPVRKTVCYAEIFFLRLQTEIFLLSS